MKAWQSLCGIIVLLCALSAPAQAQRRAAFPTTPSEIGQALYDVRLGFQRLSTGDPRGAIELLTRAINSGHLPEQTLGSAYFFRGAAYREQGNFRDALADLEEATLKAPEKGQVPVLAFDVLMRTDDYTRAYVKALSVARDFPQDANSLDLSALLRLTAWLEANRREKDAFLLRAALFDARYRGGVGPALADDYYRPLIAGYLEQDDVVNAVRVASSMINVDTLIDIMVDRRYQDVWDSVQAEMGVDFAAAAQRQLKSWRAVEAGALMDADSAQGLIDSLRVVGQADEAVRFGEQFLQDPTAVGRGPSGYFWVIMKTAYADVEAGEAARGLQRIAELGQYQLDDYPDLVIQRINQAALALDQNRSAEALRYARSAESRYLSAYGRLWVKAIEVCVAVQQNQAKPVLEAGLVPLREGRMTNPAALAYALLCTNRLDEAEQWYVRRLGDARLRADALQALQIYARAKNEPAFYALLQERLAKVRERAAVQKAIARVGRVLTIALPRTVVGGY
jgi:tetratricopeptide (TPR) repeat protein